MSYLDERRKHIEDGRPLPPKKKYTIPKKSSKRIQKEKEQGVQIVKAKPKGWFDAERVDSKNKDEFPQWEQPKSSVTIFEAPKWMQNEANEVVKELKPFEGHGELGRWFMERKIEMTGKCMHCNGDTMILNKEADSKFHYSVCHILPKNLFPSIATHPQNWIELCYYGNSCHKNFDDHMIDIVDLNCFGVVIERFVKMYPSIAISERRKIPTILIEYLKTEL